MSIYNVITVTGPPGSGKSEAMREIKTAFEKSGMSFVEIDEYTKHIRPWAKKNKEGNLVNWRKDGAEDNFVLDLVAYEVMCPAVAESMADEIVGIYRESKPMVFLLEAARNVGEPQVGYVDGLWQPLKDALMVEKSSQVNIVNVEVVGGHRDVLWERLEKRLEEDPKAAPPECLENYHFDEDGLPILASNELKGVGKELVGLSLTIKNGSELKDLEKEIETVTWRISEEVLLRHNVEGVLRTNLGRKES